MDRYESADGKTVYEVGNELRGWVCGTFPSDEEAWAVLSNRFNDKFPSHSGRSIFIRKIIGQGFTAGGNETESDRILRERHADLLASEEGNS